ncbi:MAG: hypothetical protein N2745_04915 [Syntrophorhabdaceae bacterium]|nr:hypothetical protein [Syntrophorhabdaceae bacterium]
MEELLSQSDINALFEDLTSDADGSTCDEDTCVIDSTGDLITQDSLNELLGITEKGIPKNTANQQASPSITSNDENRSLTQDEIDALLREFNLDV